MTVIDTVNVLGDLGWGRVYDNYRHCQGVRGRT